ncbi:MAG: leucine-rich repeat protein [Clostridia bacterium]|nr:leucine-rich repeat protein [Clostridia bacterium]
MKKRILLGIIMVLALMCMLAISISAVDIDGVHYTLNTNNQTAKVSTGNKTATTEVVIIPSVVEYEGVSYKVTSIEGSAFAGNTSMKELHILSEYITVIPSSMINNTYNNTGFTKIYIDFSKITRIESAGLNPSDQSNGNAPKANNFYYYDPEGNKITTFDFPNIEYIGFAAFQGANFDKIVLHESNVLGTSGQSDGVPYSQTFRMSSATSLHIKGDVEAIYCYSFSAMTNLKTVKIESTNLTMVGAQAFAGCKLLESIEIDLSKCTIVGGSAFSFSGSKGVTQDLVQWYNLEGEKIVDLSSVQKISSLAFNGSNLGSAKVIWPTNYTKENFGHTSDSGAFRSANLTGMVYFDAAEGTELLIDGWVFRGNKIDTVIFGPGVTKVSGESFKDVTTIKTVVFLADSVECTSSNLFKGCSGITFYHKELTNVTTFSQATQIQISSGSLVSCGKCGVDCSVILASDNSKIVISAPVHTWDDGVVNEIYCPLGAVVDYSCEFCSTSKSEGEGTEHSHTDITITYANGYFANGVKETKCANCPHAEEESAEQVSPIFYWAGFSTKTFGDKRGFGQRYIINTKALEDYRNAMSAKGIAFSYGVVASGVSSNGKPLSVVNGAIVEADGAESIDFN